MAEEVRGLVRPGVDGVCVPCADWFGVAVLVLDGAGVMLGRCRWRCRHMGRPAPLSPAVGCSGGVRASARGPPTAKARRSAVREAHFSPWPTNGRRGVPPWQRGHRANARLVSAESRTGQDPSRPPPPAEGSARLPSPRQVRGTGPARRAPGAAVAGLQLAPPLGPPPPRPLSGLGRRGRKRCPHSTSGRAVPSCWRRRDRGGGPAPALAPPPRAVGVLT